MAPKQLTTPTWAERKKTLLLLVFVFYLDLAAAVVQWRLLLPASDPDDVPELFSWTSALVTFIELVQFGYDFESSTGDVVFVAVFRALTVPLLLFVAVKLGNPDRAIRLLVKERTEQQSGGGKRSDRIGRGSSFNNLEYVGTDSEDNTPLLSTNTLVEARRPINSLSPSPSSSSLSPPSLNITETEKKEAQTRALTKMNIALGCIFVIETFSQVHIGIKTVLFPFEGSYTIPAICLVSLIVWMNMELFIARSLAEDLTKDVGKFFPHLHQHVLHFTSSDAMGHICDLCRKRRIREAYRCSDCDFDLCLNCTRKKSKGKGEGLIRGDGGVKEERDISNWEYLRRGLFFAKPHLALIIVAVIMMLAGSLSQLLLPNYQGKILDSVIKGNHEQFVTEIKFYVGFTVAVALFGSVRKVCFSLVGRHLTNSLRNHLFASVIVQDIAFFDGMAVGELTSRLRSDVYGMVSPVQSLLSTFLSSLLYLGGGLVMCLYTSWRLSVLAFTTIGPIVLVYRVYSKWSRNINRQIWAAWGDASSVATQSITNVRTVRAFGMEEHEKAQYEASNNEGLRKGIKDAYASAGTVALANYIDLGISVLILWYGGSVALKGSGALSVGNLIVFQLYWGMINNAYNGLSGLITQFTRAGGAAQRVMRLLDNLPDIDPNAGTIVNNLRGDIQLNNVHFHYQMRPEQEVLKGINLSVKRGEVLALVGRSGGGKSTLVHLMLRFYNPVTGSITIDGHDLRDLSPLSYRKHIGIVAQDTQLFNSSIEENIAYGVETYTREDLVKASVAAHAHEFIMKMEDGYATRTGERGIRLSGGQRQRIAIARAFLRKPKLLFLDEATSALDSESEGLVQEAIDKLIAVSKCTVVLVAHRLSTVINADQIAVVDSGQIVEQGTHSDLIQKNGVYASLVQRQIAKQQNTIGDGEGEDVSSLSESD
eukprot:TRINITY_DN4407_c0_g1_i1.p1 TRINITY_DN4407_c0_g1~~TRINITY_DN4407_c0_g1_i1.p1  ORF type:complete len:948 (-),score=189.43 TRINITY_DN4407_c0_g1_i1:48-2849(-)